MGDSNKKFIIISMLLVLSIGVIFILNKDTEKIQLDEVRLKDNGNNSKKMFAIMVEDSDNSDTYKEYNENNGIWPGVGYLFNSGKSSCMDSNGEKVEDVQITYNAETHQISVSTHKTVYCYLYFKKDSEVPDVTNFYVGTHHGSEYTNQENQTVHIEWNDEDVEEYCIKEETENNDSSNCVWKSIEELSSVDLEASHKVETTIDLGTENKKYDFDVFLKDRAGNESTVDEISEDEIILDTQAPTISNISQVGEAKETSIEVSVTVNDPLGTDGMVGSGIEHIYYQIKEKSSGTIKEAYHDNGTLTTYIFDDNLTQGTEYTVEVYAVDKVGNSSEGQLLSNDFMTKKEPKDNLYKLCKEYSNMGECIENEANNTGDIFTLKNSNKGDLQYRYVGGRNDTVNNYVCFGNESCSAGATDNHMYRIIGITSKGNLKIQKNSSIGAEHWHSTNSTSACLGNQCIWEKSTMYTSTLKNTFYDSSDYVTSNMKSKIEKEHTWNTGDVTDNTSTTSGSYGTKIYEQEKTTNSHTGEVGLAYLSDYYFAYNEEGTQDCKNGEYCPSWMIPNYTEYSTLWSNVKDEWTMSQNEQFLYGKYYAWSVHYSAGMPSSSYLTNSYAVRPVFYLTSDVTITSGSGALNSPYIIN